jgi:hypothetical protein
MLNLIREKYETANEFEQKVLLCFLSQPMEIGYSADSLRPLNLNDSKDFMIYYNAVRDDYRRLVKDMGFHNKELAYITYTSAWELLDIEIKPETSKKEDPYACR